MRGARSPRGRVSETPRGVSDTQQRKGKEMTLIYKETEGQRSYLKEPNAFATEWVSDKADATDMPEAIARSQAEHYAAHDKNAEYGVVIEVERSK